MLEMSLVLFAFLIFAVIHTLMAGRFKQAFRKWFGDRAYYGLYRLLYNAFSLITLLPVVLLVVFNEGGVVWRVPLSWEPVMLAAQLIGLIGLAVSLLQIDLMRFAGITQAWHYVMRRPLPLPDEPLQIKGLYRLMRHPLYLFSLLILWPVTTMTWAYLGFCIGATVYFAIGSVYEERRLLAAYGDSYAAYQARVPWLIPWPRGRKRPS